MAKKKTEDRIKEAHSDKEDNSVEFPSDDIEVEENKPQPKQDENSVKELELTDLPGVGAAAAEKLAENGFTTVMSISVASPITIATATGIGEKTCRKIIAAARDAFGMGFDSAFNALEKRKSVHKLKLNCESFDEMMDGGIETSAVTELYGGFGSGKSQVAHLLAVTALKQFPDSYIIYIDTEGTFRPERIKQFAEGQGVDIDHALKHIKVAYAHNTDHQALLSEKVEDLINVEKLDVKVVIVDSVMSHFRAEYIGRGTLSDRQQKLNKHLHVLSKLAHIHNLAVVITNQVMSDPAQFFGDPTKAVGGNIIGHLSDFRLYLRKGAKDSRVAKLVNAPNLPDGECSYAITNDGFDSM